MSTVSNWGLGQAGASIAEVSYEAAHASSGAANLLVPDESILWIAGDPPQHVTLSVSSQRPAILFAGWNVRHDYPSNPKVVEISAGASVDTLESVIVCKAVPGAGKQVWQLPYPLPPSFQFIRFTILETFGGSPTYMNHVMLLDHPPDKRYQRFSSPLAGSRPWYFPTTSSPRVVVSPPAASPRPPSSPGKGLTAVPAQSSTRASGDGSSMRQLLNDLNEDIRLLKPIQPVSPKTNPIFSPLADPQDPSTTAPPVLSAPILLGDEEEILDGGRMSSASQPVAYPQDNAPQRIAVLERTIASMQETIQYQREDINLLKRYMLQDGINHKKQSRAPPVETCHFTRAVEMELERQREAMQDRLDSLYRKFDKREDRFKNFTEKMNESIEKLELDVKNIQQELRKTNDGPLTIDFPEEALSTYVTSLVELHGSKNNQKLERKLVHRLDQYLADVIRTIAETVEERVVDHLESASELAQRYQYIKKKEEQHKSKRKQNSPQLVAPTSFYHYHQVSSGVPVPSNASPAANTGLSVGGVPQPSSIGLASPPNATPAGGSGGLGVESPSYSMQSLDRPVLSSLNAWAPGNAVSPVMSIAKEGCAEEQAFS